MKWLFELLLCKQACLVRPGHKISSLQRNLTSTALPKGPPLETGLTHCIKESLPAKIYLLLRKALTTWARDALPWTYFRILSSWKRQGGGRKSLVQTASPKEKLQNLEPEDRGLCLLKSQEQLPQTLFSAISWKYPLQQLSWPWNQLSGKCDITPQKNAKGQGPGKRGGRKGLKKKT
jgi:hypothetical protein